MTKPPNVSNAEWRILHAVWDLEHPTVSEVLEVVEDDTCWKYKTVQTMLRRLVDKGVLTYEKDGREYRYSALLSREDCSFAESKTFLDRVFDGNLVPFFANYMTHQKLDARKLRQLRKLIDEHSKKKRE